MKLTSNKYNIINIDVDEEGRTSNYEGKSYVTLTSGGVKKEGDPFFSYYTSRKYAREAYDEALKEYIEQEAKGRLDLKIVWRTRPEIMTGLVGSDRKPSKSQIYPTMFFEKKYMFYNVYSRLIITDMDWPQDQEFQIVDE